MTEPLHILVTGTSRGIGAAIVAALAGHQRVGHAPHGQGTSGGRSGPLIVVGHSSGGGDGRIAADLADPGGAAACGRMAGDAVIPERGEDRFADAPAGAGDEDVERLGHGAPISAPD